MTGAPNSGPRRVAHVLAFLAGGGTAFLVDAGVLLLLTRQAGLGPYAARAVAIALATLVGWLIHRTFTFPMEGPPTPSELARYCSVQSLGIVTNYTIYSAILLAVPAVGPLAALAVASLIAMVVSYLGMRRGVFRRTPGTSGIDHPPH